MAKAPTPKAEPRHETKARKEQARRSYLAITIGGERRELWPSKLGPADDDITRRQLGTPISAVIPAILSGDYAVAGDTLLLLWWITRRKNGEPGLSWRQVLAEFPTNDDLLDAAPDLDLVIPDLDEDAPEA